MTQPHSRTTLLNTLYLAITLVNLALGIFAVVFNTVLVYDTDPSRHTPYARQTIQSFTCSFYRGPGNFLSDAKSLQLPVFGKIGYPSGFGRVCRESEASLACMAAVLGLSVVGVGLWGVGRWCEKGIERSRRVRYDEKWEGSGSEERGSGSGKVTPDL